MSMLGVCSDVISKGKNVCGYVAKKGKSVRRQLAYYTVPADIRAGIGSKFKHSSFSCEEINNRADRYEHYLLRNGKIVKTVDSIKKNVSKINDSFNNLGVVKSTKKTCKKIGDFLDEWFGDGPNPPTGRKLLSYEDIMKQRNSGS